MIYHAETLSQLREAVESLIGIAGEDAPVGLDMEDAGRVFLNPPLTLDVVYVNAKSDRIVGDEADSYQPNAGERKAVRVQ